MKEENVMKTIDGELYYYYDYVYWIYDEMKRLQEENERLHIQLEDRAYEQIKFLYKDYKSRIDKAIEYINLKWGNWGTNVCEYNSELIEILKGDSNE